MPGAREGLVAEVVDIRETEREFLADMPPLEPLDMNMVTRANTILFRTAKELANGNRRRAAPSGSAPAELFLVCSVCTCRWDRGELKASVWRKLRNRQRSVHAQKRNWSLFWYTHNGIPHTLQRTQLKRHHDRQTKRTEKNAGKKNYSRLCPLWKSLFAAMVRERVTERRDEHFSSNWHGLLRGRRREGVMLAQRCMGWHPTTMEKSHLNSLTDMSDAFSCTQRETMEEAK